MTSTDRRLMHAPQPDWQRSRNIIRSAQVRDPTAQYPPNLSLVPTPRLGTARQQASRREHPARVAHAIEAVYWFYTASSMLRWGLCLGAAPHSPQGDRG